ncbi:MAG TPA: hemin uptake protein HemP [Phycisphaerales bacterium]|nr:hemin uptake protein HemP [Phycisphaerales bacterium]
MEIKNKANESDIKRETRLLESSQLFGSDNEIMIRHQGSVYRLRITRNGKLIMNK